MNYIFQLLKAIWTNKCPKCYKGDFFLFKNPFNKSFATMHKNCSECKQNFEFETGFYYGAMYVSYGLTVAIALPIMYFTVFVYDFSALKFTITITLTLLIVTPILYRASRIIWLAMFIKRN